MFNKPHKFHGYPKHDENIVQLFPPTSLFHRVRYMQLCNVLNVKAAYGELKSLRTGHFKLLSTTPIMDVISENQLGQYEAKGETLILPTVRLYRRFRHGYRKL
jgi:hypothetical protein